MALLEATAVDAPAGGIVRDLPITPAKLLSPGVERRSCSAQRREE